MEVTSGQEETSLKRWKYAHCIIEGCPNNRTDNPKMTFHSFPIKNLTRFKCWLAALNLDLKTPTKLLRIHSICEEHFVRSDYKAWGRKKQLNDDAVPSIGINTQPIRDKMAVLKAWEETAELSDGETLIEDENELEPLTLSSDEDEDQTDPSGSSVREENKELGDQDVLLFAPIEEDSEEEVTQGEENGEARMEERSAPGGAEEDCPLPDWNAPSPKRTRLHSPERSSHDPQSSASSESLMGFKLNGRHVSLQPVGGGVQLKLISRTGGSACGFTSVKLSPISKPSTSSTSKTDIFPVITGVVCGSAAEVLTRPTVNSFDKAVRPQTPTLSSPEAPSLHNMPSPESLFSSRGRLIKPKGPLGLPGFNVPGRAKPPQKGVVCGSAAAVFTRQTGNSFDKAPIKQAAVLQVRSRSPPGEVRGQIRPPDCTVCHSHYMKIESLRGFVCLCSKEIIRGLRDIQRFKAHSKKKSKRSTTPRTDRQSSKTRTPRTLPPPLHYLPSMSPPSHVAPPKSHLPPPVSSPLNSSAAIPLTGLRKQLPSRLYLHKQLSSPLCSTSASPHAGLRQQLPPPVSRSPLSHTSASPTATLLRSSSPPPPQQKKPVILVEDFFYGTVEGRKSTTFSQSDGTRKKAGPYLCDHCHASLENNTSFMSHTQQHMKNMYEENHCPHCYRSFQTPFELRRHMDVHSPNSAASTCKICELSYENETALLHHMKSTHKPGEMPYICLVCEYRSSFYSSVVRHFREAHVNTCYLLCVYCLRVFTSRTAYQQHTARHARISTYRCKKCRLLFLFARDRKLHKQCCHVTHIRPPQLVGLKPGTTVTIRSQVADTAQDETAKCLTPSPEQVSRGPGSSEHLNNTEPPVVILDEDDGQESATKQDTQSAVNQKTQDGERKDPLEPVPMLLETDTRCIECNHIVSNDGVHFVSGVRCSLCTYVTYCFRAYANHMMSNHMNEKTGSNYSSMYQLYPRLPTKLRCQFCTYVTTTGDMMANHLAEHPDHCAMALSVSEEQSSSTSGVPAGPASPQLSINDTPSPSSLTPSPSPLPTSPPPLPTSGMSATTPTLQSPQTSSKLPVTKKDSEKKMSTRSQRPPPLSATELQMVLYSLCNGVPQAAKYFRSEPSLIRAWTLQHIEDTIKDNAPPTWHSDYLAEWVLTQREQQLCVSEDSLMRAATKCLKPSSCGLREAYCWAVNFMVSHSLSLQPLAMTMDSRGPNRPFPKNLSENAKTCTQFLQKQLETGLPPTAVGYLDELSIFVDLGRLSSSSLAFSLFSSQPDTAPVVDIMLSGLSDGSFFSPVIFYAGAISILPKNFPTNIILLTAPGGFTEQCRLDRWHQKVWGPHMSGHNRGVLIMDSHRGHLDDHFLSTLSSSHTAPVVIPIGCSSRLQPLDVCITPVVREFLQARWNYVLSYGGIEDLTLEHLVVAMCFGVSKVASTLSAHREIIRRSFAMVLATPGKVELEEANEMIQTLTQALIDSD